MAQVKKRRWPLILGGALLVLLVGGVVALRQLDAYLLTRVRTEAADFSQRAGRTVTVGDLSTTLFPTLGLRLERLAVGPAAGEDLPLATVERVDIQVPVMAVLRSRGSDVPVSNAEVEGLTLNVLRLKDGTTNLQRLQDRLASGAPPKPSTP